MGLLIVVNNDALIAAGAKRRLWWSATTVAQRTGTPMLPIDAALAGVAMGRWVAVTQEQAAHRPGSVRALLTAGFCVDTSATQTLRDVVSSLPRAVHPTAAPSRQEGSRS